MWQVRIEGGDRDVMVGYKGSFKDDPLMGTSRQSEVTTLWSGRHCGRPENTLTGVTFTRGGYQPHWSQRDGRTGRLHRASRGALDFLTAPDSATETSSVRARPWWATNATGVRLPIETAFPTPPEKIGTPPTFEDFGHVPDPALHP